MKLSGTAYSMKMATDAIQPHWEILGQLPENHPVLLDNAYPMQGVLPY